MQKWEEKRLGELILEAKRDKDALEEAIKRLKPLIIKYAANGVTLMIRELNKS
jgi:hypothetical protein